jgi:nucleoside-diphosphate-sugar epimerase
MNKDIEIVYDISRPKQIVSRRQADISKIRKILGFNPNVSVDEGLKRIIESMER